jgi:hypothetical protein
MEPIRKSVFIKKQFRDLRSIKREIANCYNLYIAGILKVSELKARVDTLKVLMQCDNLLWERKMIQLEDFLEAKEQGYE